MRPSPSIRIFISSLVTTALVFGIPSSARAEGVNITSIGGKDASYVSYIDSTWTVSVCGESKKARKGYVQVKSGKKWKKLTKVSKSKTTKDTTQCDESSPYLTDFTYTETKPENKKYRLVVPSGYKLSFEVFKDAQSGSDSGTDYDSSSRLMNCSFFGGKKLAGKVWFSSSPDGVDYRIYESTSRSGSDLTVHLESNTTFANTSKCGRWYEAYSAVDANFVVYLVTSPREADFVVNYTFDEAKAGVN